MENLILKTGFNNLDDDSQSDEIKLQTTALITVFMENALKTAEIYTKEANSFSVITALLRNKRFSFEHSPSVRRQVASTRPLRFS